MIGVMDRRKKYCCALAKLGEEIAMRGRRPAKKRNREDWLRSCTLNLGYKKWARSVVMEDGRC
jgi:hypothetical protein